MKSRWFSAALATGISCLAAQTGASGENPAGNEGIVVMTCNVRTPQPKDDAGGNGWPARRDFCIDTIRKQRPDIIAFQECSLQQYEDLHAAFPEFQTCGVNGESPLSNDPYEVIFISPRFAVITTAGYWLSETPHVPGSASWDNSRHPRVVNWARLVDKKTGDEFRLLNSHFDHRGKMARVRSALMVVADSQAFPAAYPQIFTGDLNAEASNPCIAILKEGGWLDAWEQLHGPEDPGFTAHDFLGEKFTTGDHHGKIDWIFYRGALKPVASAIIRDSREGHYPSDHYFVTAKFVFEKPVQAP